MTSCVQPRNPGGGSSLPAPQQLVTQSLALVLVVALALTSLGPMIDHHFVERHPGHAHLFFSPADFSHSHDFQRSHDHHGSWMYGPVPGQSKGAEAAGVAYFMPNDGIGYGAVDLTIPFVERPHLLFEDDVPGIFGSAGDPYAVLTEATVAPPKRPPRA